MSIETTDAANQPEVENPDDDKVPEEEVTVVEGWAPSVTLEVKETVETGEETEECIYTQRSKLFRWVTTAGTSDEGAPSGEWKERGTGDMKLMKHKQNGKIRALMRQEKTMKIVANHYPLDGAEPYYNLRPNAGSDKFWVWMAQDYAEGELAVEQFALKFGNAEKAKGFETAFTEAKTKNMEAEAGSPAAAETTA